MLGFILLGAFLVAGPAAEAAAPVSEPVGQRIALTLPARPPVTLYFEEQGDGPPLLLLHGLGESSFTWREIAPALAANHRVIALDLKGFGRSEKPDDGAYSAEDQAALVARFIVERGLEALTLIGHSFGGTVALRTALADGIANTPRIRRIVVIGAPALPRSTARYLDVVKAPLIPDTLASAVSAETLARLLLREAMGGRKSLVNDDLVEGYAAPYRDPAAMTAFLATARAIVTEEGAEAIAKRYATLDQPTLVVWCRKDPIVPVKAGRHLKAAIPHAELTVLEGCHHLPQHERPKQLLKTLAPFLGK
jgi:pimeloyl-ACP methyl ester carboxylesterase